MKTAGQAAQQQTTAEELVKDVVNLVSLPEVYLRLNEMIDNPHCSTQELGEVIGQDPSLTARLLKMVNSSFFGFPQRVETVSRAVTVIGLQELRTLVAAAAAVHTFSKLPNQLVDMVSFWRHSVYCGVTARLLAKKCHVLHSERLFIAGLLHDIGHLIMYFKLPEIAHEAIMRAKVGAEPLVEVERELMGFDHADVGRALLVEWQLPQSLQDAVGYHHHPAQAKRHTLEAAIVSLADGITHIAELPSSRRDEAPPFDPEAWKITQLSDEIVEPVLVESSGQFAEALTVLLT